MGNLIKEAINDAFGGNKPKETKEEKEERELREKLAKIEAKKQIPVIKVVQETHNIPEPPKYMPEQKQEPEVVYLTETQMISMKLDLIIEKLDSILSR